MSLDFLELQIPDKKGETPCIYLAVGQEACVAIGEKLHEICDDADMNGYNWQVLLTHYIEKNHKNIDMESFSFDCEAETCILLLQDKERVADLDMLYYMLCSVLEHPQKLYDYVSDHGDEIEWD